MPLANLVIVVIMSRSDFYSAGAIFHIGVLVGDDWDLSISQRQVNFFTNKVFVSLVFWVYSYGCVTKQCLWASSRYDDFFITINHWVCDIPELALFILVIHLNIGKRSLMFWTIVNEFFASVNHAVFPHFFECGIDTANNIFVQSKGEISPRTTSAKSSHLELHVATLLLNKIPNLSIEFVTGVFKTGMTLSF